MSLNIFCRSILGINNRYELSPSQVQTGHATAETVRSVKVPNSFKSTTTGKSYLVHTFVTCKTKGGIYLIECKSCGINALMGKTKNSLHKYLNSLRFDIRCKRTQKPVSAHFNLPADSMEDLTIMIIEKIETNYGQTRRI